MLAKSYSEDRAQNLCVCRKPDTDSASDCTLCTLIQIQSNDIPGQPHCHLQNPCCCQLADSLPAFDWPSSKRPGRLKLHNLPVCDTPRAQVIGFQGAGRETASDLAFPNFGVVKILARSVGAGKPPVSRKTHESQAHGPFHQPAVEYGVLPFRSVVRDCSRPKSFTTDAWQDSSDMS